MSRLDDAMRRLAGELAATEAPASVESAVLAEFDHARASQARRKRSRVWLAAVSVAAAAVIALLAAHSRPAKPMVPAVAEAEPEQPFMPIPYVLPPAPYERVEVVRMQIPAAALIAAGLPLRTADPGAQAEADVLVGQDGRPRAVRLISISSFN